MNNYISALISRQGNIAPFFTTGISGAKLANLKQSANTVATLQVVPAATVFENAPIQTLGNWEVTLEVKVQTEPPTLDVATPAATPQGFSFDWAALATLTNTGVYAISFTPSLNALYRVRYTGDEGNFVGIRISG